MFDWSKFIAAYAYALTRVMGQIFIDGDAEEGDSYCVPWRRLEHARTIGVTSEDGFTPYEMAGLDGAKVGRA
jgi:hypothetical protein